MMRPYRTDDLPAVMDIGNRAWKPIYEMYRALYGEELFRLITPDPSTAKGEQLRAFCGHSPERMLICERNARVVGFISLQLYGDIGEIGNNAADPSSAERGVGQEMYQAAFDWLKSHGASQVKVTTGLDDAHAPARRAYERAGFTIQKHDVTYFKKL